MKNINGKNKQPTIVNTSYRTCGFNDLVGIRMDCCKNDLRTLYKEYRGNIKDLADFELRDRCYVARLHELGNDYQWQNEIHRINLLRAHNKRDRLACIRNITDLKHSIQRQLSLIRDFHNIIRDIRVKYNGEKYQDFKYKLGLTTYSNGQVKIDVVVLRPIQSVDIKVTPNIPDNSTTK